MWCAHCKKLSDSTLCSSCTAELKKLSFASLYTQRCTVCGQSILDRSYPCPCCEEALIAYGPYEGVLAFLVLRYKSGGELLLAPFLADLFLDLMQADGSSVLVPIPASKEGKRRRGFDQMLLIACILSRKTGSPVVRLFSHHKGRRHALLSKKARLETKSLLVRTHVSKRSNMLLLQCKQMYVLDDIHTTGSTCSQAKTYLEGTYQARVKTIVLCKA